jgi:hypothetical protein
MKNLKNFSQFNINEGILDDVLGGIGIPMDEVPASLKSAMPRIMADKFMKKILPNVLKISKTSFPLERPTWIEDYKDIFRKACVEFGGAKEGNVGETCNKPQTLQGFFEHILDPQKGLLDKKTLDGMVEGSGGTDEEEESSVEDQNEYLKDADETIAEFYKIFVDTGMSPADIKKTGTYALTILIPYLKTFFKPEVLMEAGFMKDGKIIDQSKAKSLVEETSAGGKGISL